MRNFLALMGSPRHNSHTDRLLEACLDGARAAGATVAKVNVADLDIKPCLSCYACARLGHCVIKDDMQEVYEQLAAADVVLLASPLYFFGVSAQMKALIDRGQVYWSRQNQLKVPALLPEKQRQGVFLGVGGAPNRAGNNFEPAQMTVKFWFQALEMQFAGKLLAADTDKRAVQDRPELLEEAHTLGQRLAQEVGSR